MKTFDYSEHCLLTFLNISNVIVLTTGHDLTGEDLSFPIYKIVIENDNYFLGKSPYGKVRIRRHDGHIGGDYCSFGRAFEIVVFGFDEFFLKRYWFIFIHL